MKRLLALPLLVLGIAGATRAQYDTPETQGANVNVATDLTRTSAASSRMVQTSNWLSASLAPPETSLAALSFSPPAATLAAFSRPSPSLAEPAAPRPSPYNYLEREYRWEIGM